MLESADSGEPAAGAPDAPTLERIYQRAPRGALTLAGIATALVFALWFAFYLFVFIPRGFLQ